MKKYDEIYNLPEHEFTVPATGNISHFKGWSINGADYEEGTPYRIKGDTTIVAEWYYYCKVTFIPGEGGQGEDVLDRVVCAGGTLGLSSYDAHHLVPPEGQVFDCWVIDGVEYEADAEYHIPDDATEVIVTAQWKPAE